MGSLEIFNPQVNGYHGLVDRNLLVTSKKPRVLESRVFQCLIRLQ